MVVVIVDANTAIFLCAYIWVIIALIWDTRGTRAKDLRVYSFEFWERELHAEMPGRRDVIQLFNLRGHHNLVVLI